MTSLARRNLGVPWGSSLLLALLASACANEASVRRPTVILITLDTTRADHLSTYGYDRPTDPFLSEFAGGALVFEHAVSTATWTLPSHGTMFTGLHPAEHGAWDRRDLGTRDDHGQPALSPSMPLLTTRLHDAGYHMIGAAGGPYASSKYGFSRHFDTFVDGEQQTPLTGIEINDAVTAALDTAPDESPLFLFVNYFDAHAPYEPPARDHWPFPDGAQELPSSEWAEGQYSVDEPPSPEVLQWAIDQYDRELLVQDEALAALFAQLESRGLLEDALVIITADHGEAFGELGVYGHGGKPVDAVIRVPLLVWQSGASAGRRIATPVSLTSVSSTVLTALDLPALPGGRGVDLLGDDAGFTETVYSELRIGEKWVGTVRSEDLKYARVMAAVPSATSERFADIGGLTSDLVLLDSATWTPDMGDSADALRSELAELIASWRDEPSDMKASTLTEHERHQLSGIGYAD